MAKTKEVFSEVFSIDEETQEPYVEVKEKKPYQPNPLLTPLSILIAGILIGGAIIYNGRVLGTSTNSNASSNTSASTSTTTTTASSPTPPDFVKLAEDLKLNTKQYQSCLQSNPYATSIATDQSQGNSLNVSGTPSILVGRVNKQANTVTGTMIFGAYPYDTFKTVIDGYISSANPTFDSSLQLPTTQVTVTLDDTKFEGNTNAQVGFIEFADYECPYCKQVFDTVLPSLRSDYVQKGTVLHGFKDFPLTNIHPWAMQGAIAAQCAGAQGKYWQMHDLIYENQSS